MEQTMPTLQPTKDVERLTDELCEAMLTPKHRDHIRTLLRDTCTHAQLSAPTSRWPAAPVRARDRGSERAGGIRFGRARARFRCACRAGLWPVQPADRCARAAPLRGTAKPFGRAHRYVLSASVAQVPR